MRNNNSTIVRKITKRSLIVNRSRNFFIMIAIVLTTFMITSVFNIGLALYKDIVMSSFRFQGGIVHGIFSNPSAEQLEMLEQLDYVECFGLSQQIGFVSLDGFTGAPMFYIDEKSWEYSRIPVFSNVVGHYAVEENEIMLSRAKLSQLGIDNPYVGMEISLNFAMLDENDMEGIEQNKNFILSAIYTEYVSSWVAGAFMPVFVSHAFAESQSLLPLDDVDVHLIFTDQRNVTEFSERLMNDLYISDTQSARFNPILVGKSETNMFIAVVGVITGFLLLTGFLLIYNVMYMSVSKDVRFYGMLKTLGTTSRQLRKIVNGQVLYMYVIGMPIGLLLSVISTYTIVPAILAGGTMGTMGMSIYFSPIVYVGGAIFSLITTYLGAFTSARKAGSVSPVDAVRYAGQQNVTFKTRLSSNGKPSRIAWRNVLREKKQAMIVLLSLFLGITVFTIMTSFASSIDIENVLTTFHDHDILIPYRSDSQNDNDPIGMDRDFIAEIIALPQVLEVMEDTITKGYLKDTELLSGYVDWIMESSAYPRYFDGMTRTEVTENLYFGVRGIDTEYLIFLNENRFDNPIDIEAFERGEIAIIDAQHSHIWTRFEGSLVIEDFFPIGTTLDIEIGENRQHSNKVEISAFANMNSYTYAQGINDPVRIIMSNRWLKEHLELIPQTIQLGVNITDGAEAAVLDEIEGLLRQGMWSVSIYSHRQSMESMKFTIFILGASISSILGLIGLLNFSNVIAVGLLTRKREFATLESIGMTKKQTLSILRWEGAIYWIVTIFASITLGTGISYGLFTLVHNQDPVQYPQFVYPLLPIAIVFGLIIVVCSITPELAYRSVSKSSLVDRLREAE